MNDRERYLFDVQGCLVIENVLGNEQLARLNQAIDEQYPQGTPERIHDFFTWDEPVFRDLIVDPVITRKGSKGVETCRKIFQKFVFYLSQYFDNIESLKHDYTYKPFNI